MATLKTTIGTNWTDTSVSSTSRNTQTSVTLWDRYLAFVDGQSDNRTLWFFISLSVHATVFLPLPIFLIGYFNAPVAILAITMVSFFTNFVANMGGSGIRTTLTCFIASIIIHLSMVIFVLAL